MPWAEYEKRVRTEWAALLQSAPPEAEVQRFLERHPALVPGAHIGLGSIKSGHAPFPCALITQPTLQGLGEKTPDFLWIASDSAFLNPVFIEIERPDKRWLTKKGHAHHHLTQALHQINTWDEWFDRPANRQIFYDAYQLPRHLRTRKWKPIWVLVYGRREEHPEAVSKLRAHFQSETKKIIPYEHLEPDADASDYLCVRQSGGRYVAVTVPPTVRVGPFFAEDWSLVENKEEAASATAWSPDARKQFLTERFGYWDAWAATGAKGIVHSADFE